MKSKLKKMGIFMILSVRIIASSETKEVKAQQPGPAPHPGYKFELPGALYACVCPVYVAVTCSCIPEKTPENKN